MCNIGTCISKKLILELTLASTSMVHSTFVYLNIIGRSTFRGWCKILCCIRNVFFFNIQNSERIVIQTGESIPNEIKHFTEGYSQENKTKQKNQKIMKSEEIGKEIIRIFLYYQKGFTKTFLIIS